MDGISSVAPQARLFVGMGGAGIKTLSSFVKLLTQHSEETKLSEVFTAYLLVDTDRGDLATYRREIETAYRRVHREPIVAKVHLSEDITDFQAFVSSTLQKRGRHHDRLKEVWWYRPETAQKDDPSPFTALNLKDPPTLGAGQCPLVSTFLAWNKMRQIETALDELLNTLKNRSVQGENLQNWTLDVSLVSSLAGGTGRGCWHLVASKIREKLRDLNIRPKPTGFFFDSSVFAETVKREEQFTKLQVNSLTGVSELVAWLRNEYDRETDLEPFQFRLPSLDDPAHESSDLIDTTKLNATVTGEVLPGVSGRAPVSAAYLIFGAGKQGRLGRADAYYSSVAYALYARLAASVSSKTINEAGHLNGLAAATISVPIDGVKKYISGYVTEFLPKEYSTPLPQESIKTVVDRIVKGIFDFDGVVEPIGDEQATNVPQRVYRKITNAIETPKHDFNTNLKKREYDDAEAKAEELTTWADNNEAKIQEMIRQVLVEQYWGVLSGTGEAATPIGGLWKSRFDCGDSTLTSAERDGLFKEAEGPSDADDARPNPLYLFVRRVLGSSRLRLKNDGQSEIELDISSYGTKHAIAEGVIAELEKIRDRIKNEKLPSPTEQTKDESPGAMLKEARTGFFSTGVTDAEIGRIDNAVEPWILSSSNKVIVEGLRRILVDASGKLERYRSAVAKVSGQLSGIANERNEETGQDRKNFFWIDGKDFERILDDSAFDQEILSTQTLKAVATDEELVTEFRRVMTYEAPAGFSVAQAEFFESLEQWIEKNSTLTDRGERRLPDLVAEGLRKMSDQFMLPDKFYEDNFGFFETVKRLVRKWGEEMVRRQGSPQDRAKLANVFRNQFGIEYRKSQVAKGETDSPRELAPRELEEGELDNFAIEVCQAMAVRLGGRCDPLFQQRFDEGERPTYDSVVVVLPAEDKFGEPFRKKVDELAMENPQFQGPGNFAAVETYEKLDTGNPYTMFAYATQQFDDWRRDAGMARIASLEYYKTPLVLNWLRACEDPNGAAVFVDGKELRRFGITSHRDIYGLGYISPSFVRNETLRELRWSPWDESKKRSANKRTERLDLLVYALLAPPPQGAQEGSLAAEAKHFGEILKKAKWDMPLLTWQDPPGNDARPKWYYTRQAFRKCTKVTDTEPREAKHPAFGPDHGHPSIRRCYEELLDNHAIAEAIAGEAVMFLADVLRERDFEDDFRPEGDIKVTFGYLRDRLLDAKTKQQGPAAEKMKKLIDDLLARVKELEALTPEQLQEHYEGILKNTELHTRA